MIAEDLWDDLAGFVVVGHPLSVVKGWTCTNINFIEESTEENLPVSSPQNSVLEVTKGIAVALTVFWAKHQQGEMMENPPNKDWKMHQKAVVLD